MAKTAVGLFATLDLAHQAVRDLEAGGFQPEALRVLSEPQSMAGANSSSTPRLDFQTSLHRDLEAIGATGAEAETYVRGLETGGVLVFASGDDVRVHSAVAIMNRGSGASGAEALTGGELHLPSTTGQGMSSAQNRTLHAAIHIRVV